MTLVRTPSGCTSSSPTAQHDRWSKIWFLGLWLWSKWANLLLLLPPLSSKSCTLGDSLFVNPQFWLSSRPGRHGSTIVDKQGYETGIRAQFHILVYTPIVKPWPLDPDGTQSSGLTSKDCCSLTPELRGKGKRRKRECVGLGCRGAAFPSQ